MKDDLDRSIETLRLSVTDACSLDCVYCIKATAPARQLELEEIKALLPAFLRAGIRKIRLTGGEPLLHPQILDIIEACAGFGFQDIAMTTNALGLEHLASPLRQRGLQRVNISLNSLRRETYARMTGADSLENALRGITAALSAGLAPVKINVVLMRGINGEEAGDFIAWTQQDPVQVRFIEYMPMGAPLAESCVLVTRDEVLRDHPGLVRAPEEDTPVAEGYRMPGHAGSIGFISPRSQPFCSRCTRIRITSSMTLRPCLGDNLEVDLRDALRQCTLDQVIRETVRNKPQRGFCPEFRTLRPMSGIGG